MSDHPKYIYLVLSHPQSVVSDMIHIVTGQQYTHSSLALSSELTPMFSFARKYSRFPFWGSYRKESLIDGFYSHCSRLPGRIVAIPVTDEQFDQVEARLNRFWENREKLKYNVRGLFFNAVGIASAKPSHYTCSQFVSETLEEAGICRFDCPFSLIRPQHLAQIDGNIIFEGDLKSYISSETSA